MEIAFIQTGGTIDKDYPRTDTTHGYNFEVGDPTFEVVLKRIKPAFEWKSYSFLKKDSLDMTDEDRQNIYSGIRGLPHEKLIITHGTDTIFKTAEKLSGIPGKLIILTGAMLPGKFAESDAMFNLGMATGAIQTIRENGVFICLYGKVVPWQDYPALAKQYG